MRASLQPRIGGAADTDPRALSAGQIGITIRRVSEAFHAHDLLHGLAGLRFGHPVYLFQQIGSTNDEARRLAQAQAPEGLMMVAEEQTAGRRRAPRRRITPPRPPLPPPPLPPPKPAPGP